MRFRFLPFAHTHLAADNVDVTGAAADTDEAGDPTYCKGMPLLSPIFTSPDGETLIKLVFGTIMYLRPATMAIDCGGVLLMSNSERFVVRLAFGGIHVVMPPMRLPPPDVLLATAADDDALPLSGPIEAVGGPVEFAPLAFPVPTAAAVVD